MLASVIQAETEFLTAKVSEFHRDFLAGTVAVRTQDQEEQAGEVPNSFEAKECLEEKFK